MTSVRLSVTLVIVITHCSKKYKHIARCLGYKYAEADADRVSCDPEFHGGIRDWYVLFFVYLGTFVDIAIFNNSGFIYCTVYGF